MSALPQMLDHALKYQQAGELAQAEQIYREVLQIDAEQVDALHLFGLLAVQVGKHDVAIEYIGQALRLKPDFAEAHNNLGCALMARGQLDQAVTHFDQALRLKPDYVDAVNNLRLAVMEGQRLVDVGALNNLGIAFMKGQRLEEAMATLERALRLKPDFADAHCNLARALIERRQFEQASASCEQALRFKPNYAEAYNNLGITFAERGRLEEAVASFQEAVRLKPGHAEYNNLGRARLEQGKVEDAVASYEQALRLTPDYAEARNNLAMAALLRGRFEEGWTAYEWRWQCKGWSRPRFAQPPWDGSALDGQTILLHAEQGVGDTLQFIRYAPLVRERGGRVLLTCPAALIPLLARCRGIDQLFPQGSSLPAFDVQTPLLSLPRIFGTTLTTVPANVPYLSASVELTEHWRRELSTYPTLKIAIAWQGNPEYRKDQHRSIPLPQFAPLARLEGVQLFSVQKGPGTEQLGAVAGRLGIIDLGPHLDNGSGAFMDTAAVLMNVDLVITSDTALAHLAGALGVRVWVALPFAPDWRWLLHREDSPWYPTMRLFRQVDRGSWEEVFKRMASELAKEKEG